MGSSWETCGVVWTPSSSTWIDVWFITHTPYIHAIYHKPLQVFPSYNKSPCSFGGMQDGGEARNRKHPPWVLLLKWWTAIKAALVVCWETKRAFDHLGAHHFLMPFLKHDYQEMSPLTLYVANSTQSTDSCFHCAVIPASSLREVSFWHFHMSIFPC